MFGELGAYVPHEYCPLPANSDSDARNEMIHCSTAPLLTGLVRKEDFWVILFDNVLALLYVLVMHHPMSVKENR